VSVKAQKKSRRPAVTQEAPEPRIALPDPNALSVHQAWVVLAIGFAFGVAVLYEWGQINGFPALTLWGWPWQDLGSLQIGLALLAPFLLIAAVLWVAHRGEPRIPLWILLATLAAAQLAIEFFSVLADPRGLERISAIVSSANATGYFTDAQRIQHIRDWMAHFLPANLTGHAQTHPAGPILFYYVFVKLFGQDGAFWGGCAVGLAASLGPLVMYGFAGLWTADRNVRLVAAAFYALLPGMTVFFPEFDQIYSIFSMLLIGALVKALNLSRGWRVYAFAAGAIAFVATFFAYNLLMIGAFLLYYALWWWWQAGRSRAASLRVLEAPAIAAAVSGLLYLLVWATTGYNALEAFRHSLHAQAGVNQHMGRHYGIAIFTDVYDFFLAAGIIAAPILWFHLRRQLKGREAGAAALTWIGVATVLTVDLSGLLRGETARVWLFLQPLLVVPVAIELARLRWNWRLAMFTMQWWLLVAIKAKMSFVEP